MKDKIALDSFSTMPVTKAVIKNAIPAMVAMLMVLIYNLADTFFIGQTHDAYQVAAVSLATPVFLMFMSIGTIFGVGGTSVISRAMGEGRYDFARKVCSFCFWACVVVGFVLSLAFILFIDEILVLIGASEDTWEFAKSYLVIVSFSGIFVLISNCYSNILRAEGEATKAMIGQIIGNMLNVILDPLMILTFGWDIAGAAIATVLGNIAAALYYLLYFWRGKSSLTISIKEFSIRNKICLSVLAIGIPASLAPILMSVSQIVMNSMMALFGDMALAGIGVAMKITMITSMIAMGVGQGVQPLLGFSVGAKNFLRYKKILVSSLVFAFLLCLIMTLTCYLFTDQIAGAFLQEGRAFEYAVSFSRILLTTSSFFGVFYVLSNALQAMGDGTSSLIINLSRQGFIYIPALFILKSILGYTGLVWAQPVADIISTIIAYLLFYHTFKKLIRKEEKPI